MPYVLFLVGWLLSMPPPEASSQNSPTDSSYTVRFDDWPLEQALHHLIATYRTNLVYDADLIATKRTTCYLQAATLEAILTCMLAQTSLTFKRLPIGVYLIHQGALVPSSAASANGQIRGTVRDASANTPLAGASVRLMNTPHGTATNHNGQFTFAAVPEGTYVLEASMLGFESVRDTVVVRANQQTTVTLRLFERTLSLQEVVVMPGHFTLMQPEAIQRQSFSRETLESLPTLGDDPYRVLQRLPGITGGDFSSKMNVRGGAYEELLVQLDGLTLYEPFHIREAIGGGIFSIIDTEIIGQLDMMTGAFSAEYGDRLSGVFDIQSATPRNGQKRTSLGLSVSNARFLSEGTFAQNQGYWQLVARRGYIDVILERLDDVDQVSPRYYDVFGKIGWKLTPDHTLTGHVLYAYDLFRLDDRPNDAQDSDDEQHYRNRFTNTYSWLRWQAVFFPRLLAQTVLSATHIAQDRESEEFDRDSPTNPTLNYRVFDERTYRAVSLKQDWTFDAHPDVLLRGGFETRITSAHYDYASRVRFASGYGTTALLRSPEGTATGGYLSTRLRPWQALTAEVGARFDHTSWTSQNLVSPRLNIAWASTPATILRLGWGHAYQAQGLHQLNVPDNDDQFYANEWAEHRVIGLEHTWGDDVSLRVEAYQKKLHTLRPYYTNLADGLNNTLSPETELDRVRLKPLEGEARGLEALLRWQTYARWSGWVGYAWATTEENHDGTWIPRAFDQRHSLYLDLTFQPNTKWRLHASWQWRSGWPYTPQFLAADQSITFGQRHANTYAPYHRLDLRATRTYRFSRSQLDVFLDITNLYNQQNERIRYLQFRRNPDGSFTGVDVVEHWLPLIPSVGLRWDLFH